ncbi:MAG: class I SAM-dependent methyltransferase, partial [Alphaproteobacteria bacterium]|nr:class I SAM-dependent methyltransferase [Alphaproteobacteria bacterium]
GTGRMAELFAPHAAHVTALDRSPEMLQVARARLQDSPAGLVDLVQGDFAMLPFGEGAFDTVLFHQVLHYARDPGAALAEAARVIAPGGTIALVDFASHDREELRERHAHARLGFSDEQMLALLTEAGFACRPPVALSGTPLTVKIWMARKQAGTAPTTKPAKQARAVRP